MPNFLSALSTLFSLEGLLFIGVGCLVGMVLGAIPGLGGELAITILLPMTFSMNPNIAIGMLVSIWVGSTSGGFIGSILLGIPGTPSSVSTCYDGYAMTKNGEVSRALSIGTLSNFLGTFPSILIAMFLCPVIAAFAVKMGPWEYFALALMAISLVVSMSGGKVRKGFIAAAMGLLVTQIGYSPISSTPRFNFGSYYLAGGFGFMTVLVGLFACTMISTAYAKKDYSGQKTFTGKIDKFHVSKSDLLGNIPNIIRSFLIGLGIGILPGMGAAISNVVAYSVAKASSKTPEKFGTGCSEGIFAPEVSNNAAVGGAVIPMISLGIPGDGTTAVLLSGLVIQGVDAGPLLQTSHPVFTYMIFLAALFAATFSLVTEILGIRAFPKLLKAPYHYLYPAILVLSLLGTFTNAGNLFSVYAILIFAVIGLWFSYAGIPATPFILSFILGPTLESNFRKAISYSHGDYLCFFKRPASCVLMLIAIFAIVFSVVKPAWDAHKAKKQA